MHVLQLLDELLLTPYIEIVEAPLPEVSLCAMERERDQDPDPLNPKGSAT